MTYDLAGRLLSDGINHYLWEAQGKLCGVTTATNSYYQYIYDAEGNLVTTASRGNAGCNLSVSTLADFVVGQGGQKTTTVNGSHAWQSTNVYANGELLATYHNAGLHFALNDCLGTKRIQASPSGTTELTCWNLPFNDASGCSGPGSDATDLHYTGKERDAESGLDHFLFRNYASTMGRWMSPDPAGMAAADLSFPQTLNRYAYVNNNPLSFTDPLGLDCAYLNNAGNGLESFDQNSSSGECGRNGGYWVDGGLTNININADKGTVQLTGTTDGTNQTSASYQDTTAYVTEWHNTWTNPFNHIGISLAGQWPVGQNPRSDAAFQLGLLSNLGGPSGAFGALAGTSVKGAITTENRTGNLVKFAAIPVTGMQANMIQNAINQGTQNPPNYSILGGLDCSTWVQQVLGSAGISTGPAAPFPADLMNSLGQMYPTFPGHP